MALLVALLLSLTAPALLASSPLEPWVDAAFRRVRSLTRDAADQRLSHVSRANCTVYIADGRSENRRLITRLPDGSLSRRGVHDVVLVVDPFPDASFGHLVFVFFVDLNISEEECREMKGFHLGGRDCLIQGVKNRCHNLMEKKTRRRSRRCEIKFLPLVYFEDEEETPPKQLLVCRDDIKGFAPCPQLRSLNATQSLVCNPLHVNTQRCSTSRETVHTRCRLFETCDQGVIIAGGWNREHSPIVHTKIIRDTFYMLRGAGFLRNNIKIFYANGAESQEVLGEDHPSIYPAAMKLALRYHIQKMCNSNHCVDSLVLYLNSPARSDGSMLLWDVDGNGEVDETEVYTVKELLTDLKECLAKRIYIIADQSYSNEITRAFARSKKHSNVIVFSSGSDGEYSWNYEFSSHWTKVRHMSHCTDKTFEESFQSVLLSTPTFHDGSNGKIRTTLYGAPCDILSSLTMKEIKDKYIGCQNLPTKIWMTKYSP